MEKWGRQLGAASGLVFVALFGLVLFLPGAPPKASQSAGQIAANIAAHRSEFLLGTYLAGVALLFGAWFFVAVRAWFAAQSPDPDQTFAAVAQAGGFLWIVLMMIGIVLFTGVAFDVAAARELAVTRGLFDAGNSAFELAKFGLAIFVGFGSLAARRHTILPPWFTSAGLAAAPLAIIGAIGVFASGSFVEIGGPLDLTSAVPATLWVVGLSVAMLRDERAAQQPRKSGLPDMGGR
jgi:hypothetical protein